MSTNEKTSSTPQKTFKEDEKALKGLAFGSIPEKNKDAILPFLRGDYGEHESRRAYREVVKSMDHTRVPSSRGVPFFKPVGSRGSRSQCSRNTRDGVILRGDITFVGDRGALIIHAAAVYSPTTNSLVGQPIIKDAYLAPNMEKWVEKQTPNGVVKAAKQQSKTVSEDTLQSQSQQQEEDPPRPEKSSDEDQEERKEK